MRSLRNNMQSAGYYSTGEVYRIVDDEIEEWEQERAQGATIRPVEFAEEFEEAGEESFQEEEYSADGDMIPLYVRKQREEYVQAGREEAQRLIAQAAEQIEADRAKMAEEMEITAAEAKEQAYSEGYEEGMLRGIAQQQNEISKCVRELQESMAQLAGEQMGFMAEYEQNLRWLALEIASKVLARKIMEDDRVLEDLVTATMQGVQNAQWVSIEISDKTEQLMEVLQRKMKQIQENRPELRTVSGPPGTVIVETPEEVIDASVSKQLENLRKFFEQMK